jgi:hypothetical protein
VCVTVRTGARRFILASVFARFKRKVKAMSSTYDQSVNGVAHHSREVEEKPVRIYVRGWCPWGAVIGFSGGVIAALVGSLLTAVSWFTATENSGSPMRALGTILLFVTIPLLIFGAHCLDLREAAPKERKKL